MTEALPYDLREPSERDYFDRYGNGLVAVLPARRPAPADRGGGGPPHGGAWIHVGEDGTVRAFTGKVEVGQGTRTALSLLVAEELGVASGSVRLTMGDTDACPWDMGTFGSRSMPDAGEHLRAAGAAARAVLLGLGAARLGVPAHELELYLGRVRAKADPASHPSAGYGDLVSGLRRVEIVGPPSHPIPPSDWTVAGHRSGAVDVGDVVTGARQYTSDLHPTGMLYGKILFPPAYGAKLRHVDLDRARSIPGVTALRDGEFVAVAAPTLPAAMAALKALGAEWETVPQPSERTIIDFLRGHPAEGEDFWDVVHYATGDAESAVASAPVVLHATYTTPYIAHVPMETHAVLASWEGERLTVWLGSQTPFRARESLVDILGLHPSNVRVVVPPTGCGFGGKHADELAAAAAQLSKATGRPVRITYTREEEFTHAYFRPLAVIDIASGARADGTLQGWKFHNLNAGSSAARGPYRIPHQKIDNQPCESPLPQGAYRGLAATANNFARESHVDEIATRVGADPVEYRLRHLADDRLAAVLRAVAERSGWVPGPPGTGTSRGVGQGIAIGAEKGGRVATFAEIRILGDRRVEIVRIVTGFECGAIVHPTNLRAQVEGGTIMALGGALFEAIHFADGRITNPRLSEYRVPRFRDIPPIDVLLLDRKDLPPQGAGETPLITVAPAIANAIYDATEERHRSLPLTPDGRLP